jgi:hypothetical protein
MRKHRLSADQFNALFLAECFRRFDTIPWDSSEFSQADRQVGYLLAGARKYYQVLKRTALPTTTTTTNPVVVEQGQKRASLALACLITDGGTGEAQAA